MEHEELGPPPKAPTDADFASAEGQLGEIVVALQAIGDQLAWITAYLYAGSGLAEEAQRHGD